MAPRKQVDPLLPVGPLRDLILSAIARAGSHEGLAREFADWRGDIDYTHVSRSMVRIKQGRMVRMHTADEWCTFLDTSLFIVYREEMEAV